MENPTNEVPKPTFFLDLPRLTSCWEDRVIQVTSANAVLFSKQSDKNRKIALETSGSLKHTVISSV